MLFTGALVRPCAGDMTPRSGCGVGVMNTGNYMVESESYIRLYIAPRMKKASP